MTRVDSITALNLQLLSSLSDAIALQLDELARHTAAAPPLPDDTRWLALRRLRSALVILLVNRANVHLRLHDRRAARADCAAARATRDTASAATNAIVKQLSDIASQDEAQSIDFNQLPPLLSTEAQMN